MGSGLDELASQPTLDQRDRLAAPVNAMKDFMRGPSLAE
jgi:hypothetical protein